jgi:hypothetical protein
MNIYEVAKIIVIIEFSLIFIFIVLTYFFTFMIYFLNHREKKLKINIEKYLTHLLLGDEAFQEKIFKKNWRRLEESDSA